MATLAWPRLEQDIRLDAVVTDGRLAAKRLVTTRSIDIGRGLAAQALEQIPQRLAQLFPLCGAAHAIAGITALEDALRVDVSPAHLAFRNLVLLVEHGVALGWRILMDWPPLLGAAPQVRLCADIRRAAAAISASSACAPWARIGGVVLRLDRDRLGWAVSALSRMLAELFPEAADPALSQDALQLALSGGTSTPARLISAASAGAMADYGHHDRPTLPHMAAGWFADRLASQLDFAKAPTLDGTPAEVGPLAARRHPLVAEAAARWGPTLATRLLAAALDVHGVAGRLLQALDGLADADPAEVDLTGAGRGAGVVETARGPLAYLVEVADLRLRTLRSVAPTEWNFHPDGPFMTVLSTAPRVPDPVFAARLLAASFDPCVPFTINLSSGDRLPSDTELELRA